MATASNMLAGAGYGNGATLQDRAEDIYTDMVAEYGVSNTGWTDTALDWWLHSSHNTWSNPYQVVTVKGYKNPKYPWDYSNGILYIGNKLRECSFIGLSISWPVSGSQIGTGGHAITCWGDNGPSVSTVPLSGNPDQIHVTDSDSDSGGDIQTYDLDVYSNPNPGGPNEGNGWYFNYPSSNSNNPYIKHIIILSPLFDGPFPIPGNEMIQKVIGSYKIHQYYYENAVGLSYDVSTNAQILSYKTTIDWPTSINPWITEIGSPRTELDVFWDLYSNQIPYCNWVTITTEFVLPAVNAITYDNVYFTPYYEVPCCYFPSLSWEMLTPEIQNAESILNVCGGHVVGAFDIIDPELGAIAEYRFLHQYSYNQDPEIHIFQLTIPENDSGYILENGSGYTAKNFRFGHSYGYLDTDELWNFGEKQEWLTTISKEYSLDKPIKIRLNWDGQLPYPEGDK
jgi:hypothetical protein